jgi:hypothetical protein
MIRFFTACTGVGVGVGVGVVVGVNAVQTSTGVVKKYARNFRMK